VGTNCRCSAHLRSFSSNDALQSRFRIDGVPVDHIQNSITQEGPISWITSGKLDAVFDIKFPRDPTSDLAISAIIDAITTSFDLIPGQRELLKPPLTAPDEEGLREGDEEDDNGKVVVDVDLRFRDIKAAVPIFTKDLSYVNNALIRPIVAFMKCV
jgi:distribution and morphology protein 31